MAGCNIFMTGCNLFVKIQQRCLFNNSVLKLQRRVLKLQRLVLKLHDGMNSGKAVCATSRRLLRRDENFNDALYKVNDGMAGLEKKRR